MVKVRIVPSNELDARDLRASSYVATASGAAFRDEDVRALARLVFRRFGHHLVSAASAWRRLLQNNCTAAEFGALLVDLCAVCGETIHITGNTTDGRLIGSCGDAFTADQWESDE